MIDAKRVGETPRQPQLPESERTPFDFILTNAKKWRNPPETYIPPADYQGPAAKNATPRATWAETARSLIKRVPVSSSASVAPESVQTDSAFTADEFRNRRTA